MSHFEVYVTRSGLIEFGKSVTFRGLSLGVSQIIIIITVHNRTFRSVVDAGAQ